MEFSKVKKLFEEDSKISFLDLKMYCGLVIVLNFEDLGALRIFLFEPLIHDKYSCEGQKFAILDQYNLISKLRS